MSTQAQLSNSMAVAFFSGALLASLPILSAAQISEAAHESATPHFWSSWFERDAGSMSPLSRVLHKVSFGLQGSVESRKDRLGIFTDGIQLKSSDSPYREAGALDPDVQRPRYSLLDLPRTQPSLTNLDLVGGARYNAPKLSLRNDPGALDSGKLAWDPFVGVRITVPVAERWSVSGYADFGALNGMADRQLIGSVNYTFSDRISGRFGYRLYRADYDRSDVEYDIAPSGFFAGVGIRF